MYNLRMNIYLVRHTEYYNPTNIFPFHLPVYLSEEGRAHAKRIGKWFKENNITLPIYTSPIMRTVQTSEIIASFTDSFVTSDPRLRETESIDLLGKPRGEKYWEIEPCDETREKIEEVQKRIVEIFNEKKDNNEECILISHGDPLTALYYYLLNKPLMPFLWYPDNEKNCIQRGEIVKITIDNDSISPQRITV